jgi:WD40 repeat protein
MNQKEIIGMIFEEKDHHEGSIYCIDWSLSGKLIATGSNDKTIKLMSIPELIDNNNNNICNEDKNKNYNEPIELQITGNEGIVRSICFDPTSDLILLSANLGENYVKIWDTEKGENISILEGHNASVNCVKWSNDSQLFGSSSLDKTIRFWDIREEKNINLISGIQYANINDISIYSKKGLNNTYIACGHSDGLVTIWDYNKRFVVKELYEHNEEVRSVNFSPDGKYLITGSFDSTIKIFDVNLDFKLMGQLNHKGRVVSCKWHPEIPIIISTSADCTGRVWIPSKF